MWQLTDDECIAAMNGKQGDGAPALPQQKLSDTTFPAGKDIYEAMLYKTSDRKRLNCTHVLANDKLLLIHRSHSCPASTDEPRSQ